MNLRKEEVTRSFLTIQQYVARGLRPREMQPQKVVGFLYGNADKLKQYYGVTFGSCSVNGRGTVGITFLREGEVYGRLIDCEELRQLRAELCGPEPKMKPRPRKRSYRRKHIRPVGYGYNAKKSFMRKERRGSKRVLRTAA